MKKKLIRLILNVFNVGIVNQDVLNIFNAAHSLDRKGIKVLLTPYSIVSQETEAEVKNKLSHSYILENIPDIKQLPKSILLNWKPDQDSKRTLQTALDYRAFISSNQYISWFGSKFAARVNVSGFRSYWRQETMRQLRIAYPNIFKGKVIELGGGTGLISCEISNFDETDTVYCLDYDDYTVENLMPLVQNSLSANVQKIKRVIGSYNTMDVDDGYFDAVVAVGAMHHSEDLDATMAESYRVLKPGGNFIISDYALTGSLNQEEYSVLTNLPLNECDAKQFEKTGETDGMQTNASISEHERPFYLYLAAAFNAGFNLTATFFDATKDNGGSLSRIWRRLRETFKTDCFYAEKPQERILGYDQYGNVRAFSLANEVRYPSYAKDAPSFIKLLLRRDDAGKPIYDNMVLKLQKPEKSEKRIVFQYPSGKKYHLPVSLDL